jgi:hypothetical protein
MYDLTVLPIEAHIRLDSLIPRLRPINKKQSGAPDTRVCATVSGFFFNKSICHHLIIKSK